MDWDKTDVIHFMSDQRGYRSYLEICTPTTGNRFDKIDKAKFEICHRLMYQCPDDFDDHFNIDFRAPDLDTGRCVAAMLASGLRYDIILVDSFHYYGTSYRDLADALDLLADHGSIVVHDCIPPSEDLIGADFVPGPWCGVSFMAFVDFVNHTAGITHVTIDTDCGCGIVRKAGSAPKRRGTLDPLLDEWTRRARDPKAAYRFMIENKGRLLNLVSVDAFKRAEMDAVRSGNAPSL